VPAAGAALRAGAQAADDERPAKEAEKGFPDKAFHEGTLQRKWMMLCMVPAKSAQVFSRRLRHVSLCFAISKYGWPDF
jgi:hypothetical protein